MDQRAFADQTEQREFCNSLEEELRKGEPERALHRVRERLAALKGGDQRLVRLALNTNPEDVRLIGWHALGKVLSELDKREQKIREGDTIRIRKVAITAVGIDFSLPFHFGTEPDTNGNLEPILETNYYEDVREVAFSRADRKTLCESYTKSGAPWQGVFEEINDLIAVEGIDALYGAIQSAKAHRRAETPDGDAYVLAACASAILLHLAVRNTIASQGLPKPLTVLVGSNEDFPFFDAPVWTIDEGTPPYAPAKPNAPRNADASNASGDGKEAFDDAMQSLYNDLADVGVAVGKLVRNTNAVRVLGSVGATMAIKALRKKR